LENEYSKRNNSAVAYRPACGGIESRDSVVDDDSLPRVYVTLTKLEKHDSIQLQLKIQRQQIPHITACAYPLHLP